jgi:hypothetical protein
MERDKPAARGTLKGPAAREQQREIAREEQREREGKALGPHPVGTAVGGVAGAVAAGAAVGSVAGPIGAAVGGAIGAAAGGMAGTLAADAVDPKMEDEFWRKNWSDRKYIDGGFTYDQDWSPAYCYGVGCYNRGSGRHFGEQEAELAQGWEGRRGESRLDWDRARPAARDAWDRARTLASANLPHDEDRDKA